MKFKQHYSGSTGNLYEVTSNNGSHLLIECGVPWKKIIKALNYNLENIVGCLVTHEHHDHSTAIEDVIRAGIDVYASYGTLYHPTSLFSTWDELDSRQRHIHVLPSGRYGLGEFSVLPFGVNHDAAEPLGFAIHCDHEYMLFATDTSHLRQRIPAQLSIIAIECSYDLDILTERVESGDVSEVLAKRLLTSHMEKANTMRYIEQFCDLSRCREIHLLHLSKDNIDAEATRQEFEQRFFIETTIVS